MEQDSKFTGVQQLHEAVTLVKIQKTNHRYSYLSYSRALSPVGLNNLLLVCGWYQKKVINQNCTLTFLNEVKLKIVQLYFITQKSLLR